MSNAKTQSSNEVLSSNDEIQQKRNRFDIESLGIDLTFGF